MLCLPIHLLVDIWVISSFWLWWKQALEQISVQSLISRLLCIHSELLNHMVILFNCFRNGHTVFQCVHLFSCLISLITLYCKLNALSPSNSYVKALIPNVMVFGGGASGKYYTYEGVILTNEISALIRKITRKIVFLSLQWEYI